MILVTSLCIICHVRTGLTSSLDNLNLGHGWWDGQEEVGPLAYQICLYIICRPKNEIEWSAVVPIWQFLWPTTFLKIIIIWFILHLFSFICVIFGWIYWIKTIVHRNFKNKTYNIINYIWKFQNFQGRFVKLRFCIFSKFSFLSIDINFHGVFNYVKQLNTKIQKLYIKSQFLKYYNFHSNMLLE